MSGKRITRSFNTALSSPPEQVFPLLCPVREYDWIPQWQCELVYTQSGSAELGCVFKTDFKDHPGPETWVVCTYDKDSRVGFVKTGTHCTTRYNVSLERQKGGSTITWEQEITSLDEQGDMILELMTAEVYEEKMQHINRLLEYYLLHGKPNYGHGTDHR